MLSLAKGVQVSMCRLQKFVSDRSGNFGVMGALLSLPLILAAGVAIDYSRHSSSSRHLQELTDMAALHMAASKEQNVAKLEALAIDTIEGSRNPGRIENVRIVSLKASADDVDIELRGDIPATFMSLAGYERLVSNTSALAERAVAGNVEVALVLDNTYSMKDTDAKGVMKIDTLKTAASALIKELMQTDDGVVRIGLVPYADYVNVGTQYRNESWLDVGPDFTEPAVPCTPTGVWITTKEVCVKENPKKTCTTVSDGITETYECSGGCAQKEIVDITPYQECKGGKSARNYKWYGCVRSRPGADFRLHDNNKSVRYPGRLETSQGCLNPIVTLTSKKDVLLKAVDGMIINRGSYRPNTYIPAGLIWGLNVLSPGAPFEDSGAYDPRNVKPRKVAVLMTDGENTLYYKEADGTHATPTGGAAAKQKQLQGTNDDTTAICDYMKAQNIEIFTVAFMVNDANAKSMLEKCATDSAHYYDATDSDSLLAAFSGIGASLRVVRLSR